MAVPAEKEQFKMDSVRPRILAFVNYYLPGYKSGGPVRSVSNLVSTLSTDFDFWIITRDRDFRDPAPYSGIEIGAWNRVGQAMVYYSPTKILTRATCDSVIKEVDPAVIYLSSYFSFTTIQFLAWRRLGLHPEIPAVLAPQGEFSPRALCLKRFKKRIYNALARPLGLYEGLTWQASTVLEESEIRACWGDKIRVQVASDIPCTTYSGVDPAVLRFPKNPGALRLVFLSRISPMKNLLFAIESLRQLRGEVSFDIFGPLDSDDYWRECQLAIKSLPAGVRVNYRGSIENEQVVKTLSSYHFLFLPTLGENFGHVIFEAFIAGTPVLISDHTSWRDLVAQNLGWDLPLDDRGRWLATLQECVFMDTARHHAMSEACGSFAKRWVESSGIVAKNITLFRDTIQRKGEVNAL